MKPEHLNRDQRKERTRLALLLAAGQVFVDKGFNGASVDLIAEKAGYTKGAVYFYFKNKEEMLYGVIKHRSDLIFKALNEADHSENSLSVLKDEKIQKALVGDWFDREKWMILMLEYILYMQRNSQVKTRFQEILVRDQLQMIKVIEKKYRQAGVPLPLPAAEIVLRQQIIDLGFGISSLIGDNVTEDLYQEMSEITDMDNLAKDRADATPNDTGD